MKKVLSLIVLVLALLGTASLIPVNAAAPKCFVGPNGECVIPDTPPPPADSCSNASIRLDTLKSCTFETTNDVDSVTLQPVFKGKYRINTTITYGTGTIWITTSTGTTVVPTRTFYNNGAFEVELQRATTYKIYVKGSNTNYSIKLSLITPYEIDMGSSYFDQKGYAVAEWDYDYAQLINTNISLHNHVYQFGYTTSQLQPWVIVNNQHAYQTFKTQLVKYDEEVYHEVQLILAFFQSYLYDLHAHYDNEAAVLVSDLADTYIFSEIDDKLKEGFKADYYMSDFLVNFMFNTSTDEEKKQLIIDTIFEYAQDQGCAEFDKVPKVGKLLKSVCKVTSDKIKDFGNIEEVKDYLDTHSLMDFVSDGSDAIAEIFIQSVVETYIFSMPQFKALDIIAKLSAALAYLYHGDRAIAIANNLNDVIDLFDTDVYGNIRIDYTTGIAGNRRSYYNPYDDNEDVRNLFKYNFVSDIIFSKTFVNVVSKDWYQDHTVYGLYPINATGNIRGLTFNEFTTDFRSNVLDPQGWTPPNMFAADSVEVYWGTDFIQYDYWNYPSA